jgi:Zn-dependent protease with chaperone function
MATTIATAAPGPLASSSTEPVVEADALTLRAQRLVEEVAAHVEMGAPDVRVGKSAAVGAAAGLPDERPTIVVNAGLLEPSDEQARAVIAHELGHHAVQSRWSTRAWMASLFGGCVAAFAALFTLAAFGVSKFVSLVVLGCCLPDTGALRVREVPQGRARR